MALVLSMSSGQLTTKVYCGREKSNSDGPKNKQDSSNERGGYYRIDPSKWKRSPPFVNALKAAAEDDVATFCFPGHNRGRAAPLPLIELIGERPFLHDILELESLSTPKGPIFEAQKQAAEVFGASKTWFLIGGTTSGIHAAIMGVCSPGETLILPRNSHISAISAMVLSGLIPKYIYPDYDFDWDLPTIISPSQVKKAIEEAKSEGLKPGAVFITSPTYQGMCNNIKEISTICHLHNIPLIVDEAHGAHFGFPSSLPLSALEQGADVVIQSTHKVLFSFTQSSMLHVSRNNNIVDKDKISRCLHTLQSTSPNPLLLASLDATTVQLKNNSTSIFDKVISLAIEAKNTINQIPGINVLDFPYIDPLRVTVNVFDLGFSGYEADDFLFNDQKVISELSGPHFVTHSFPPGTCKEHVDRLYLGYKHLSSSSFVHHQRKIGTKRVEFDFKSWNDINMQLTPREAFFAKKIKVDIEDSIGKICGELICPFPPGVPIMTPGEVISKRVIDSLLQFKFDGIKVVGACNPLLSSILICDM